MGFLFKILLILSFLLNAFAYHVAIVGACFSHMYSTSSFSKLLVSKGHKVTYVTSKECIARYLESGAEIYMDKKWDVMNVKNIIDKNVIFQIHAGAEFIENITDVSLQELDNWMNHVHQSDRPDFILAPMSGIFIAMIAEQYGIPFVTFWANGMPFPSKQNLRKSIFKISNWFEEGSYIYNSIVQMQFTGIKLWMDYAFSFKKYNTIRDEKSLPKMDNVYHALRSYPTVTTFYEPIVAHGKIDNLYKISLTANVHSTFQLEDDIDQWLKKSEVPIIYISLGTSTYMEEAVIKMFITAFEEQSDFRILWSLLKRDGVNISVKKDHILVKSFLPQIAILQRKEVIGFLSHCGAASIMETTSLEVPLILYPQGRDQNAIADKANQSGLGIYLQHPSSSNDIKHVLSEFKYRYRELKQNIVNARKSIDDNDQWKQFDAMIRNLIKKKTHSRLDKVEDLGINFRKWTFIIATFLVLILIFCVSISIKCCICICKRRRKVKDE